MDTEDTEKHDSGLTFAPFPTTGIWTAIGLGRLAFFVILVGSTLLYLFWDGPLWTHLGEDDFVRIVVSYTVIPIAVAIELLRTRRFKISTFLVASGVIASLKLLATAMLALLFDL